MAGRDVEITDGGNLKLYKSGANSPTDAVSINAPSNLTAPTGSYSLTMPAGRTQSAYLKSPVSGGQLAWSDAAIGFTWENLGAVAGVDPTGAADSSAQMVTALEAAQDGDHTVFIPDGIFSLKDISFNTSGTLGVGDRKFCIVGADPQSSYITVGLDTDAATTTLFSSTTALDYLELRNLTIDGKFLKSTDAYRGNGKLIDVKVNEVLIDNCTFTNFGGDGTPALEFADTTKSVHITNCRFINMNPAVTGGEEQPEAIVLDTTLTPAAGAATPNVVISGNQFDCNVPTSASGAGAVAISANWTDGYTHTLTVDNNYFNNCGGNLTGALGPAIDLVLGCEGSTVRNNVFQNPAGPVYRCQKSSNVTFSDNKIIGFNAQWNVTDNQPDLIIVATSSTGGDDIENVTITGNVIDPSGSSINPPFAVNVAGHATGYIKDVEISDNTFDSTEGGISMHRCHGAIKVDRNTFDSLSSAESSIAIADARGAVFLDTLRGDEVAQGVNVILNGNTFNNCKGRMLAWDPDSVTLGADCSVRVTDNVFRLAAGTSGCVDSNLVLVTGGGSDRLTKAYASGNTYENRFAASATLQLSGAANIWVKDVLEYGAGGGGAEGNDSNAIAQALSDLAGGEVVIPAGCGDSAGAYLIGGTQDVQAGTTITGGGTIKTGANQSQEPFRVNSAANVTFDNIRFEVADTDITDGLITVTSTASVNCTVTNCTFGTSALPVAIAIQCDTGVDQVGHVISGNTIYAGKAGAAAIMLDVAGSNSVISNNLIRFPDSSIPTAYGISLKGYDYNPLDDAFVKNVVISNNNIYQAGIGIFLEAWTDGCSITGNTITGMDAGGAETGIYILSAAATGGTENDVKRHSIIGNIISGGDYGIRCTENQPGEGHLISGNTIRDSAINGLLMVEPRDCLVNNNLFQGCSTGSSAIAVVKLTDALRCSISVNVINTPATANAPRGIELDSTGATAVKQNSIVGNVISCGDAGATGTGVFVDGDTEDTNLSNNTCCETATPETGLRANGELTSLIVAGAAAGTLGSASRYIRVTDGGDSATSEYIQLYTS